MPSAVREIGEGVFFKLYSLKDLPFKEGLLRIGNRAFHLQEKMPFSRSVTDHSCNAYTRTHAQVALYKQLSFRRVSMKSIPLLSSLMTFSIREMRTLLSNMSRAATIRILAAIEAILPGIFTDCILPSEVVFESGTKLSQIGEEASNSFIVPSNVETIGDRCFEKCPRMIKIAFEICRS
jgi:hypothetical protein